MSPARKLAAYAGGLAVVLAGAMAVGAALEPIGLSNAAAEKPAHGSGMDDGMLPGLEVADERFRLEPTADALPAGRTVPYSFRVVNERGAVTAFDIEHTKPMHVIVVRRDFAGFQHLHPEMAPDGTWTTPLRIDDAGVYRLFADFVVDGDKRTLATDLFVGGLFAPVDLPAPATIADAGDGYTVGLEGSVVAGEESTLRFVVSRDGEVVADLAEYLGVRGHLVALRDGDLAYLHVHADKDALTFEADFPTPGAYRLFLQFRHGDEVRTAAFTVEAEEASR